MTSTILKLLLCGFVSIIIAGCSYAASDHSANNVMDLISHYKNERKISMGDDNYSEFCKEFKDKKNKNNKINFFATLILSFFIIDCLVDWL